ncbi:MAG: glycosyltransferase family 2 protein, partial [Nitrosotalea sp.]
MNEPLVSIVTGSVGRPLLTRCIESVANQTYQNIQHLIFIDGEEHHNDAYEAIGAAWTDQFVKVIPLPYSVGKDNWNAHRMMAAGTHLADGDYMMYLDDDNYLDPSHVQDCLDVMSNNTNQWAFSLRKIVDQTGG